MIYKTLNNWVAKAFITELSRKHYKACIYIYMNNYPLLATACWERLLNFFFNYANIQAVYKEIGINLELRTHFNYMCHEYYDSKEL